MRFSLHLPMRIEVAEQFQNATAIRSIVQTAERAGFDACNVTDDPSAPISWRSSANGHDAFDPFAALAFIAGVTTRIRLHTHVVVLPYRNPFLTAKSAATLDVLSEGRLILGVAAGHKRGEYEALGMDFDGRGAATDEALEVMKLAWSGETVVYKGRTFNAEGNLPQPLPVQKPHPPVWGGGNGVRAIRRAAELCDGWAPFFALAAIARRARTDPLVTVDDLRAKIEILRMHLDRVGRDGPFDICAGPPHQAEACTDVEAQRMIDVTGVMAEMGVTWMVVGLDDSNLQGFLENIEWFGSAILSKTSA